MVELVYKILDGAARVQAKKCLERFRKNDWSAAERFVDAAAGRLFYSEKRVWRNKKATDTKVFIAISPEVEEKLRNAADLTHTKKCEFRVEAASNWHYQIDGGKAHFVILERTVPRKHVVLETNGNNFSENDFRIFEKALEEVIVASSHGQALQAVPNLLQIIAERMPRQNGSRVMLTFGDTVLWQAGEGSVEKQRWEIAGILRAHGMVGPNFTIRRPVGLDMTAYFESHTHPRVGVPPSAYDTIGMSQGAFLRPSNTIISIQAVSIAMAATVHKLFFTPYFRDEEDGGAELIRIRAGYLAEAYGKGLREINEDTVVALEFVICGMQKLANDATLPRYAATLRKMISEGQPHERLLPLWNFIIGQMRIKAGWKPAVEWEKELWEKSGGVLRL